MLPARLKLVSGNHLYMRLKDFTAFIRERSPRQQARSRRYRKAIRANRIFRVGWTVIFTGLLLTIGILIWFNYDLGSAVAQVLIWAILIPFLVIAVFAERRDRRLKRLCEVNELDPRGELLSDERPPILYLRSFGDDKTEITYGSKIESFEEEMVAALNTVGPVIAVGNPGDKSPPPGAIKFYLRDEEWPMRVIQLMDISGLVVLNAAYSPGLAWELKTALERLPPDKLLISFAHWRYFSAGRERRERFSKFNSLAQNHPQLQTIEPLNDTVFLHFGKDWRPQLVRKSVWREFMFSIFGRGTPPYSYDKVIKGYLLPVLRAKGIGR
jgi:hypothetical protein